MKEPILIACGGTGGHLFPGLAVAEELESRGHRTMLLVSSKQIDALALQGKSGLSSHAMPGIGWPGFFHRRTPVFFVKLFEAYRDCQNLFSEWKPAAVLGMGGFTSAVPLWIGRRRHVPTLLHESNAVPGLVTRLAATHVTKILLGFSSCSSYLQKASTVFTGTPVRQDLARLDRTIAAERFGLNPNARTLLVMGGSQGARGLNEIVFKALPFFADRRDHWQFIHLTGQEDANIAEINYRRLRLTAVVRPFSHEMESFYSLADLAISRAGAASLTELAHYGLPSVLVPFPAAADDHQSRNADVFVKAGAAVAFAQSRLTPEILAERVRSVLETEAERAAMSAAALSLEQQGAAARVAQEVEACL